jgi:hypothetical protein
MLTFRIGRNSVGVRVLEAITPGEAHHSVGLCSVGVVEVEELLELGLVGRGEVGRFSGILPAERSE